MTTGSVGIRQFLAGFSHLDNGDTARYLAANPGETDMLAKSYADSRVRQYGRIAEIADSMLSCFQLNFASRLYRRIVTNPASDRAAATAAVIRRFAISLEMDLDLQGWIANNRYSGNKTLAAARIKQAFYHHTQVKLDLSHLGLNSLPSSIGRLTTLTALNLSHNPDLSELPDALTDLCDIRDLNLVETSISSNDAWRMMLQSRLTLWQNCGDYKFDCRFFFDMKDEEKEDLFHWFVRLGETVEFKYNQKEFAEIVCRMLETMRNEEFCQLFFLHHALNEGHCIDRASMAFNELYVHWRIYTMPESRTLRDKLVLWTGCAKTFALRATVAQLLSGKANKESAESYLYYEALLREELGLETAIRYMKWPTIGDRSHIDVETLKRVIRKNYLRYMVRIDALRELAKSDLIWCEWKTELDDEYAKLLDEVKEGELTTQKYREKLDNLMREKQGREDLLTMKWIRYRMVMPEVVNSW